MMASPMLASLWPSSDLVRPDINFQVLHLVQINSFSNGASNTVDSAVMRVGIRANSSMNDPVFPAKASDMVN